MSERAKRVKDLVCGMWIDADASTPKVEHDGETYYFCSEGCRKSFEKRPELYVSR